MAEKKTSIGGQALIEGVMMKGPDKIATVVRKSDGTHVAREEPYTPAKKKFFLWGAPLIRGVVAFGSSLASGVSQIMFSAEQVDLPEEEPSRFDRWVERRIGIKRAEKFLMGFAVFLGVAFPVALFILLPTLLAGALDLLPAVKNLFFLRALTEGVLRLAIFLSFLFLTSLLKDMKRVYGYHGAEHKAVFCYEAGLPLTVENVRAQPRKHPRCGTSFLFVVMIISILIFSFISVSGVWLRLAMRLLLLPLVVGVSYEFNRLVGRHDNFLTRLLRAPGLALQGITTKEPDDDMIAVAIDALSRVIPETEGADKW